MKGDVCSELPRVKIKRGPEKKPAEIERHDMFTRRDRKLDEVCPNFEHLRDSYEPSGVREWISLAWVPRGLFTMALRCPPGTPASGSSSAPILLL